jgi:hypothetical protein
VVLGKSAILKRESSDLDPVLVKMLERRKHYIASEADIESGAASRMLEEQGVVLVPGFCDRNTCERLLLSISRLRETVPVKIAEPDHRSDVPLLYAGFAEQVFAEAIPLVGKILGDRLTDNPEVVEFSCMVSYPGAKRQPPHPDVRHTENVAEMYSVFIPLRDQDLTMGPLLTWPQTHLEFPETIRISEAVPLHGECGSLVIMNSRLFHCGGQNASQVARPVFYFTLKGEGAEPIGSTLSILPEFKGMHLGDLFGLDALGHTGSDSQ